MSHAGFVRAQEAANAAELKRIIEGLPLETSAVAGVEWRLGQLDPPHFAALLTELARDNHAFRWVAPLLIMGWLSGRKHPQWQAAASILQWTCLLRRWWLVLPCDSPAPRLLLRWTYACASTHDFLSQRSTAFARQAAHIFALVFNPCSPACMSQAVVAIQLGAHAAGVLCLRGLRARAQGVAAVRLGARAARGARPAPAVRRGHLHDHDHAVRALAAASARAAAGRRDARALARVRHPGARAACLTVRTHLHAV